MSALLRRLLGRPRVALAQYDALLSHHRLTTTTTTGAVLAWGGDALTQRRQLRGGCDDRERAGVYDRWRALAFVLHGAFISGPVNYIWLGLLQTATSKLMPAGGARAVVAKVILQSTFLQPFIFLPTFFGINAAVRGWSLQTTAERMRRDYRPTLNFIWVFWTPAVSFAFAFLPMRQQAAFFAVYGFVWNACFSAFFNPRGGVSTAAAVADIGHAL